MHVAHVSTAAAVEAVRRAKREGVNVTCEVTPHHFALIDEAVGGYDTRYKMNPPLRSAEDREAMLVALADGTVDASPRIMRRMRVTRRWWNSIALHSGSLGWRRRWDSRSASCITNARCR